MVRPTRFLMYLNCISRHRGQFRCSPGFAKGVPQQCLDVIVDQTQTVTQFKESVQFLASYRNVVIEFLQRLIAKLVVKNQSTTVPTEKSAILIDDVIEDTSIQFD